MKVSDYIAHFLRTQNTDHVFEVAGGMITHLLDSLYRLGDTNIISVHHEQAAAFAADAYGRMTGRPGIALATSGPGATNLLTGIASCYFDSSPALFITGQVNMHEQKGERAIRQLGFQETDIVEMATPVTKKCYRVTEKDAVPSIMQEAYALTMSGRPGPVLIDLPMNIQSADIDIETIDYIEQNKLDDKTNYMDLIIEHIHMAKKPLILVGQGVTCARARAEFIRFVECVQVPVVSSLLAIDILPFEHPLRVGLIGSYGNRWANLAIGASDLLIVIGSRLDIRQTGAHIEGFRQNKIIFHIDGDKHEINNRVKDCIPIVSDIKVWLQEALSQLCKQKFATKTEWIKDIAQLKKQWPDIQELKDLPGINPNHFMHALSAVSKEAVAFVADVGNHQMWAAQSLDLASGQSFITSGGMGAMGFALPAAIGCCLASGKKPVVVIAGDGGFQLNLQELQTIVRNRLPIKIVIINNQALGMIRQFQDSYFAGRYQSTYWGYTAPDFAAIANAYGISAETVAEEEAVASILQRFWDKSDEPSLLQVMINPHMNAYPKIAFGKPITEMEPLAMPCAMEST